MCSSGRTAVDSQEGGWLAQGAGPELTGHQGSGSLVEGWFQLLLDPAEKREKQAFSFPSEYSPSGSGWGVDVVKPPLVSVARCGGTWVTGRPQGLEWGRWELSMEASR